MNPVPPKVRTLAYKSVLRVLKVVNPGDVTIRHHWTGDSLRLHSFRHKNYWYHGTSRERDTMIALAQLLRPGDSVVEVGGHIGYLAMWIARLVGDSGRLVVCEPGSNNLPYLKRNTEKYSNVTVRDVAIAETEGDLDFLEEEFSGQNNSLLVDGAIFEVNRKHAGVSAKSTVRTVHAVPLDDIFNSMSNIPALVKVDVEGAELAVVKGAREVLNKHRPIWIIEVTQDQEELADLFREAGYVTLYPNLRRAPGFDRTSENFICLHKENHRAALEAIGGILAVNA
jgi:FkbM family methyltransferase